MPHPPSQPQDILTLNAIVYIDYENILELLKSYHQGPLEMHFFERVQDHLKKSGLKIIDFIAYGNFAQKSSTKHQTRLQSLSIQTRQVSNNDKNSGDLELTVEVLRDLYENPGIDIFVIISSDRDIIPLLKAIHYKNKLSYVISAQNDLGVYANPLVTQYADLHEYIEDIFNLTPPVVTEDPLETLIAIDADTISLLAIRRAMEVARYFYKSHIWERSSALGKPVSLKGYLDVVAGVVNRHPDEVLNDFRLAHCLKYVTIYQDPEWGLCLKGGSRWGS